MSCNQYNAGTKVHKAYWSTIMAKYVHDGKVEPKTLEKMKIDYPHIFVKTQEELQQDYLVEHEKWLACKAKKLLKNDK